MEILQKRLNDPLLKNTITSCTDYGLLLQKLSDITNQSIDNLRAGKGFFTYADWNRILNTNN